MIMNTVQLPSGHCGLCGHHQILTKESITSQMLQIIQCLLKETGLKSTGDLLCKRCRDDLEYIHQFILRISQRREEYRQKLNMNEEQQLYSCNEKQQYLVEQNPRNEIAVDSLPAKRIRRLPKRFLDGETGFSEPCLLRPKFVTISKYPQNVLKPSLPDTFPKVASIRSTSGSIIGDLLEVQRNGHNSRILLECSQCFEAFSIENKFRKHTATHDMNESCGNLSYLCAICQKAFQDHFAVRRHFKKLHSTERPFNCDLCPATFKYKSNLNYHLARHKGEAPYQCTLCNKKFLLRYELLIHTRIHTGEKPFKCQICSSSFAHRSNLNAHRQRHKMQSVLNVKCTQCKALFKTRSQLQEHKRKTHKKIKANIKTNAKKMCTNPITTSKISGLQEAKILDEDSPSKVIASAELEQNDNIPLEPTIPSIISTNVSRVAMLAKRQKIMKIPNAKKSVSFNKSELVVNHLRTITASKKNNSSSDYNPQGTVCMQKFGILPREIKIVPSVLQMGTSISANNENFESFNTRCSDTAINISNIPAGTGKEANGDDSYEVVANRKLKNISTSAKNFNIGPSDVISECNEVPGNLQTQSLEDTNFEPPKVTSENRNVSTELHPLPITSVLETKISTKNQSVIKTPIKFKVSPYSLLRRHIENPPSPSKPRITKIEYLPPLNLQRTPIQSATTESLPSTSSVVKIPAAYKFQCSKCLKYFKQKSALTKHERTHTGLKPYKCNLCPKAYADASNYKKHKLLHTKAADALNISRPKPPASPVPSTASDPDPDGIEAMQTIQRFELSSSDEDDMENYLWQDALQHSLMNEEIRENIKRNLMAINNAILPAEQTNGVDLQSAFLPTNYYSSENPD